MKNLHITCDNARQRQDVFNVLDGIGLRPFGRHGDYLQINAEINQEDPREYMTAIKGDVWPDSETLTYTQFMEKYAVNKLTNKINEAMTELKISKAELSRRIGKHRNYLGSIQQVGATTKTQNEIITALDEVIAGTFKTDSEVIAELTQRLVESQDHLREATVNNGFIAEKVISLETANKELMQESDGYHNTNTELNAELNTMRKIAQERAETIERINDDLTYIKEENDKLSEMASNQQDVNLKLNAENCDLAEKLESMVNERGELVSKLHDQKIITWLAVIFSSVVSGVLTQWWM